MDDNTQTQDPPQEAYTPEPATNWDVAPKSNGLFMKVAVPLVLVAMVGSGFWLGMDYFKGSSFDSTQHTDEYTSSRTTVTDEPTTSSDVRVDFVLSPLSASRGKIDVLWSAKAAGDTQSLDTYYPTFRVGIAQPLHLVESVVLSNTSPEPVYVYGVRNEQMNYITVSPEVQRATPAMLLPDIFMTDDNRTLQCAGRAVFAEMAEQGSAKYLTASNICDFVEPLEISGGETVALSPVPYLLSHGVTGRVLNNPFSGEEKTVVLKNVLALGGEYWLLPNEFKKHDEVLGSDTYNVGGYIVTNTDDTSLLQKVLDIRDPLGKEISFTVGDVTTDTRSLLGYSVPTEVFTSNNDGSFNERILGLQMFLYLNDFLSTEGITGVQDATTTTALKLFQEAAHLHPTGIFDAGTALAVRAHTFINLIRTYENYGDEEVTISFDEDESHFRFWGMGKRVVALHDTEKGNRQIASIVRNTNSSGITMQFSDDTSWPSVFTFFTLLNNTGVVQNCTISNSSGAVLERFSMIRNELYPFGTERESIASPGTYVLTCGTRTVAVELVPAN